MIDIKGKYTSAKIFTDNVEEEALKQVYNMCEHPAFKDLQIRMMPDIHAGKNCCIGTSYPIGNCINPSHVGCDIGCQVTCIEFNKKLDKSDYVNFEHKLKVAIPMGFDINHKVVVDEKDFIKFIRKKYDAARSAWPEMIQDIGLIDEKFIDKMLTRIGMDPKTFWKSICSVGGGNHFEEYDEDDVTGYFTIHCGSRNFGLKVFNYWDKISRSNKISNEQLKKITEQVKAKNTDKKNIKKEIDAAVEEIKSKYAPGYLYGYHLKGYLADMVIAQAYAEYNHIAIAETAKKIFAKFGLKAVKTIMSTHNYISFKDKMVRKGAIDASEGVDCIIPFNMRDGVAICVGKGNADWNCTAPHGAGRIMSRSAASKNLSIDDYKKSMEGIYTTCINSTTIDESPMVYKKKDEIVKLIEPTVEIKKFIYPKINLKAGGE